MNQAAQTTPTTQVTEQVIEVGDEVGTPVGYRGIVTKIEKGYAHFKAKSFGGCIVELKRPVVMLRLIAKQGKLPL